MATKRLLCLVTDRRRLARTLGRASREASSLLLAQIEGAIAGGIDLVQIREPDLEAGELARLTRAALRLAAGGAARIVVNDRADVAVAVGADGVHLRETSVTATNVKRAWPALMVGRSVHSPAGVTTGAGVDYWIAGTIFPTASKPAVEPIGLAGLARIVRAASGAPVLAIGGVAEQHLAAIIQTGAHGVAAIGAFLPETGDRDVAEAVEKTAKKLRFAFDTGSTVP